MFLHKKIFDIDLADEHGFTALPLATQNNHILTTKFLVENKANIHKPNNFLKTPIEIAQFNQNKEIIEIMERAL
ncbi:MAG: ankyrin repeat domain-containing protein [Rickettsiales bacterium]